MPAKGVFPTRENCNPNDPEEFALWAFAAPPGVRGAPFIMPIETFREWSKRLWDLGFRHVEEPTLELIPAGVGEPNWATSAGRWVPAGSVSADEKLRREVESAVARMGHQQKVDLFKALTAWESSEPLPQGRAGEVVANMVEREPHLLPLTLAVLRELHDAA